MRQLNKGLLNNWNAERIDSVDTEKYPTVGDVAKLSTTEGWDGFYVRVMPHDTYEDVVVLTDEEYEENIMEIPADMPSWVLEWFAYLHKKTYQSSKEAGEAYGFRRAQTLMRRALGLPSYIGDDLEKLEARVDKLEEGNS